MKVLAVLLLLAVPAWAAPPSGCGSLCGRWQLDAALSTAVAPAVDAALDTYRDPRTKRIRKPSADDPLQQMEAEMERSLGPIRDRPERDGLRSELMALLQVPTQLNVDARGSDILIQGDSQTQRRYTPGTPRARVDAWGTAKIKTTWKSNRLAVSERYDKKRTYSEVYSLQDGSTLLVIREIERPGLKPVRIQSVYRRS